MIKKRTTFYLDSDLIQYLKIRAVKSERSISEMVSRLIYQELLEEKEDLKEIKKILKEKTVPIENVLKQLRIKTNV